ncbi:zinc ribbon domain-containing protein [Scytonema sp. PCC 10023]
MSFFEFRRQLTYKCELYGSNLVVVDRWFPSSKTCSNCETKKETLGRL